MPKRTCDDRLTEIADKHLGQSLLDEELVYFFEQEFDVVDQYTVFDGDADGHFLDREICSFVRGLPRSRLMRGNDSLDRIGKEIFHVVPHECLSLLFGCRQHSESLHVSGKDLESSLEHCQPVFALFVNKLVHGLFPRWDLGYDHFALAQISNTSFVVGDRIIEVVVLLLLLGSFIFYAYHVSLDAAELVGGFEFASLAGFRGSPHIFDNFMRLLVLSHGDYSALYELVCTEHFHFVGIARHDEDGVRHKLDLVDDDIANVVPLHL